MNRRQTGKTYETMAAEYLESQGVRVLQRNFRCRLGEIDLIGQQKDTLLFIEVKYRKGPAIGYPAEAVDGRKQWRICRTADFYRAREGVADDEPCRFDVVGIEGDRIAWYRDAFEYRA